MTTKPSSAAQSNIAALHEEAFVNTFITSVYRERLSMELQQQRGSFLDRFSHNPLQYLDHRCVIRLPESNTTPVSIFQELKRLGTEESCYAISISADIDHQSLPVADALSIVFGQGAPSILSCIPGALAYLETDRNEGSFRRFILFRS